MLIFQCGEYSTAPPQPMYCNSITQEIIGDPQPGDEISMPGYTYKLLRVKDGDDGCLQNGDCQWVKFPPNPVKYWK